MECEEMDFCLGGIHSSTTAFIQPQHIWLEWKIVRVFSFDNFDLKRKLLFRAT